MNKNLLLFIIGVFLINFISATGLQFIGTNGFTINKTQSSNVNINFQIQNTETFAFSNVSFENNPYVSFPTISNLNSGAIANITAVVSGTSNFNGNIRIKGFYQNNLGQPLATHDIGVFFNSGVDICQLTAVEGDSVVWHNNLFNTINMVNKDTSQIIATIAPNSTYSEVFPIPRTLNYYFTTSGFQFTENCFVTSISSSGLVNNPNKDALLNLNLIIDFPATLIEIISPITNYTIESGSSADDILTIRNIGTEIARNIFLSNEWMTFTLNNFDLAIGQSRNIGYTIRPIISNTTETNQTYSKNLSVNGNFLQITKNFNIFVPYKITTSSTSISSLDDLTRSYFEILQSYCNEQLNKNKPMCLEFTAGSVLNQFGLNQSVSFADIFRIVQEMAKAQATDREGNSQKINADKIIQDKLVTDVETIKISTNSSDEKTQEAINEAVSNIWIFVYMFIGAGLIIVLIIIVKEMKERKILEELEIGR